MSKESLYKLCDALRIHLEKQKTQFRDPISVEEQVACTLYYLAEEGRLRQTANAFGVGKSTACIKNCPQSSKSNISSISSKIFVITYLRK